MTNDVLNVIRERSSCKAFADELPEREKLEAIAQAAILSPSATNKQPWQVIVVTDKALIHQHLGPDLLDLLVSEVPGLLFAVAGCAYRPEATVAGGVAQVAAFSVGGAEEHALTQVRRGAFTKGGTVDVVLPGEEGTQRFHFGLLQTRQLTDLQDPVALELFGGGLILGVAQVQAVGEPLASQLCNDYPCNSTIYALSTITRTTKPTQRQKPDQANNLAGFSFEAAGGKSAANTTFLLKK